MLYLGQENVGVRNDEVAIGKGLALGRSSRGKGDLLTVDASSTTNDTTTDIIPQVSLPENCTLLV